VDSGERTHGGDSGGEAQPKRSGGGDSRKPEVSGGLMPTLRRIIAWLSYDWPGERNRQRDLDLECWFPVPGMPGPTIRRFRSGTSLQVRMLHFYKRNFFILACLINFEVLPKWSGILIEFRQSSVQFRRFINEGKSG
jgi:hypothetical protein